MNKLKVSNILSKETLNKDDLMFLLSLYNSENRFMVFEKAAEIKNKYTGNKIYLRGLIEYSNICAKNCFYCGIRAQNEDFERYTVSDDDVLKAAKYAYDNKYASLVIQSGELSGKKFTKKITSLLKKIHKETNNSLKITLSCGEQSYDVFKEWHNAGAHRYLLRIETSNEKLYNSIHPNNELHSFKNRLQSLYDLQDIGYQTGSGVMIGLPNQTIENLADDLLFLEKIDIDMVGMGPYIEHMATPMYAQNTPLMTQEDRYQLSLLMYSLLRIMMKDINIASTTALDAINPNGRIEALKIASNVLMPNLTPIKYIKNYHLYNNKPDSLHADELVKYIENTKTIHNNKIAFGEQGDAIHYSKKFN